MTENDAAPDRGGRAKSLAGRVSCLVALLLGAAQLYLALPEGSANTSAGILGIAFCILGYYLDARKLATATVFLCMATIIISMSASQHAGFATLRQLVSTAPGGALSARSASGFACQHACSAGLSAFLPLRPRPAARDEPPPEAEGFDAQSAAPRRLPESEPARAKRADERGEAEAC